MDGFDDCVVGVIQSVGQPSRLVYDTEKVIQTLMENSTMSYEDAVEFHEYNQLGAYVGEDGPVFLDRFDSLSEIEDYYSDE